MQDGIFKRFFSFFFFITKQNKNGGDSAKKHDDHPAASHLFQGLYPRFNFLPTSSGQHPPAPPPSLPPTHQLQSCSGSTSSGCCSAPRLSEEAPEREATAKQRANGPHTHSGGGLERPIITVLPNLFKSTQPPNVPSLWPEFGGSDWSSTASHLNILTSGSASASRKKNASCRLFTTRHIQRT